MRGLLFIGAGMLGLALHAQLPISVVDHATRGPVAYAHVSWNRIGPYPAQMAVCGPDGSTRLDVTEAQAHQGVVVRITVIGYAGISDTLYSLAPVSYSLRQTLFQLDEAVVTGQYRPTTADKAVHRMRTIDAQRIARMAAENLGDVLRQELNIRLSQDNILGTSMSMQGLGGENVKVLVDGVPMIGRQNGNLDLAQIDLSGIERIEVVEGPLSVNYGTNALAGTINLITRKRSKASSSLNVNAYAEHLGRLNLAATAGKRFGRNDLLLTIGRNFFGGWDPRQGNAFYDFTEHVADTSRFQQWKPREQYFGRLGYRWSLNDAWTLGYKGEVMQDRITNRGTPRAPYGETAFDEQYLTHRLDNAVFVEGTWAKGRRLNALIAHNRYGRSRNTWLRDLTTLEEQLVSTEGMQDTSRFTLSNARIVFSNASDSARLGYEIGTDLNHETGVGDRIGDGSGEMIGDHAAFASLEWKPVRRLTLRPGARYAYNTRYGAPLIPSMNVRWQVDSTITLRASYAQGFRAPSLKELYFLFVDVNHNIVGNTDLRAERSHNYSLGLNYRKPLHKGVLTAEISGFYNAISDLITLAQIDVTQYSYVNIGDYSTVGGSAGIGWDNGHWLLNIGGATTGRYDELGESSGGRAWSYTPEVRGSVTREWRKQGWSASVFAKYQGELGNYVYLSETEVGRSTLEPYVMADANVSKLLLNERLRVSVGCKNLTDVTNVGSSISGGGVHGGDGGTVPMAIGRTWFLRLDLDLKKSE
jgi:outer membrane receptor for ferrienterochelin and colicins